MTIRNAVATVLACMALLAAIGGLAGYALGLFAPGYYRSAFRDGHAKSFDPISIGVGQGVTQGMAGGALVGLGIVWLLSWREIKLQKASGVAPNTPLPSRSTMRLMRQTVSVLLVLGLFIGGAYLSGLSVGESEMMFRRSSRDRNVLYTLRSSNDAFRDLVVETDSQGETWVNGTVKNDADFLRLQSLLTSEFGPKRAERMMHRIAVLSPDAIE